MWNKAQTCRNIKAVNYVLEKLISTIRAYLYFYTKLLYFQYFFWKYHFNIILFYKFINICWTIEYYHSITVKDDRSQVFVKYFVWKLSEDKFWNARDNLWCMKSITGFGSRNMPFQLKVVCIICNKVHL